jgi:hypothetical protein
MVYGVQTLATNLHRPSFWNECTRGREDGTRGENKLVSDVCTSLMSMVITYKRDMIGIGEGIQKYG